MTKPFGADDWMKKARIFGYFRISTDEQSVQDSKIKDAKKKTTIKRQINEVQDSLKKAGLPKIKADDIYAEVASGTRTDRPQWLKIRADVMDYDGPAVIVVKSASRWARDVDDAVEAWAPLKRRGVPVLAIGDNIQTGTANDLRPQESLWFLINQGFAAQTSQEQKKKALEGVARQKAEGVLAGTGSSLYPFAREDPVRVFLENESLLSEKKGPHKLKTLIEIQSNPNGMSYGAVNSMRRKINEIRESLTPEQFQEWIEYREWLRNKLIELDSDPWTGKLNIRKGPMTNFYPARALMRMAGLYLTNPKDSEKPTFDFLKDVILNFTEYLSDKDLKRMRKKAV